GFAVGDIRKETWVFEQEDSASTVYVKAMQGETLIRIYSGIFDGADFVLSTPIGNEAQSGKMNVKLNLNTASKLTGQRVIYQPDGCTTTRSEEHTSELQSRENLECRLLLEK